MKNVRKMVLREFGNSSDKQKKQIICAKSASGQRDHLQIIENGFDMTGSCWIACFDLETEAFTRFRAPAVESEGHLRDIGIQRNRMCLCDNTSESELRIYLMSEDGHDKRSWNKEHVIKKIPAVPDDVLRPLKVLGGGDGVLMASANFCLFYLSVGTMTIETVVVFCGEAVDVIQAILYTPSLTYSLKEFMQKCLSLHVS